MKAGGVIVLIIVLLLVAAAVGWVVVARIRAQRLGLPPPAWSSFIPFRDSSSRSASYGVQPAPGGIGAWFGDRLRSLRFKSRNSRTAAGAYEGAGGGSGFSGGTARGGTRQGFGPLDPDSAWDARVGAEADAFYYNEDDQELGLHGRGNMNTNTSYLGGGAYGGSSYDMNVPMDGSSSATLDEPQRGRSRDRSPNTNTTANANPFDDDNAAPSNLSLRGVSPRPMADGAAATLSKQETNKSDNSPTERKSLFRENV